MGKAARWFRGLLGMKKDKENVDHSNYGDKREKKRWSFGKSGKDSGAITQFPENMPVEDAAWYRSYISETEKEQSKHAIAVAAATAAAADAAVAAAQAAVAVVRLTSQGRGALFSGGRERWAAVKIQTIFRGFLSRKALRALKGVVKLQAVVRGFLVRKRTTMTLRSMQALVRAQAAVRSRRTRQSVNKDHRLQSDIRPRISVEKYDETRSEYHSKRLSASYDPPINAFDDSPKIVEIDTYKTRSRSRRFSSGLPDFGDDPHLPPFLSPRLSIPDSRRLQDFDCFFAAVGDEGRFSTAHSTPRFAKPSRLNAPATPARSVSGDGFLNYPNYMSNTQSFRAKLRSHSAPKQRPETAPATAKKKLSLNEIMESRTSFCGVRMQQFCSHAGEEEATLDDDFLKNF